MFDEGQLRQALGQFATGITVATTLDANGAPHGLTVNSFNSVSLEPPLVLWSLDKRSHQLEAFRQSGFYAINILGLDQKDLSIRFASPLDNRFDGVSWEKGKTGSPVLTGSLASLDCEIVDLLEGGDHVILLGKVIDMVCNPGAPLLYHGGAYCALGDALVD